jgi:hypothetical protein
MFDGLEFPAWMSVPTVNRPPALGRVWYVDGVNGTDAIGNGGSPDNAFQTITYALTFCVNDRNDYIIVLRDTSAQEAAWPISVNVTRVHIIGVGPPAYPYIRLESQTGGQPALQIGSVQHYEIAGFELGAGDDATPIIESVAGPGTAGRAWIHHCSFGWLNGVLEGQEGILIHNTFDWCMSVVEHCLFNGILAGIGGLTGDAIDIEGNATRSVFRNNLFRFGGNVGQICIHCVQNGSDIGAILDNRFKVPDAAAGEAITMEVGVGNAIISGNQAGGQDNAVGFCPFRDLSNPGAGNALNAWGINYADITPTLPVIV